MKYPIKKILFLILLQVWISGNITLSSCQAQGTTVTPKWAEGIVVAGYFDHGAYLNFAGPGVKFSHRSVTLMAGMLPSLRFRKDEGSPRQASVTPTLGFGPTIIYRKLALKFPLYYNAKTNAADGKWKVGVGVGIKL